MTRVLVCLAALAVYIALDGDFLSLAVLARTVAGMLQLLVLAR